jgi:hypothetical protein
MRVLLIGAVLFAACDPTASTSQTQMPTSSRGTDSAAPSAVGASSLVPTLTFRDDPSAEWPVVLYDAEGFIVRRLTRFSATELARPCGPLFRLDARPAGLLATCAAAPPDSAELRLISIPDGRVTVLASGVQMSWPADVSPDGRSAAAFRSGDCPMPAPVCQQRAVLIDVASQTEREIISSGYPLGASLEWTALGLTLFQPECAEAGCAGTGDKGGTFVWDGSTFKRWSDLRFVARSGDWTLLERLRSFSDQSDQRAVVIRGPQGEKTLSAGHALAISDGGETLVWIPGPALLVRFTPDGRALWQASLPGTVLKTIGTDALIVASPANKRELYDLKRMLRFPLEVSFAVTGIRAGAN